jgi:peptidoglycan hydrolase CwlO-like protein
MNSSLVIEILLGLLTAVVGYVAYRGSSKAATAQAEAIEADVDAKAYERAKTIYESAIDSLEGHVNRLREQTKLLDTEVSKLQQSNADLRKQVLEMQIANARLENELREIRKGN